MPHKDPEVATRYFHEYGKRHAEKKSTYSRKWYEENKERSNALSRAWAKAHPEQVREASRRGWARRRALETKEQREAHNARRRARRTGISPEQYRAWVDAQGGKCAICGLVPDKPLRGDHCHKTGRGRGLLCFTCNYGLGMFKDNADSLRAAVRYLEQTG